ncbi:hypothetical protein E2C01_008551 [Portunus trituberculatus]|uniref:Uncharacterized protein n=1 Tax=Portunus trituberculatus TaxID=210409 RepID=A0A5B7D2A3_PORTR|nr:hypothetical protein [Portunus trituberculatus]
MVRAAKDSIYSLYIPCLRRFTACGGCLIMRPSHWTPIPMTIYGMRQASRKAVPSLDLRCPTLYMMKATVLMMGAHPVNGEDSNGRPCCGHLARPGSLQQTSVAQEGVPQHASSFAMLRAKL